MNEQSNDKLRTRQQILNLLKRQGALDSAHLAQQLDVSAMAVRQHLYELQEQGLVSYHEEAKSVGRPAKQWQLTQAADAFFPSGYADLTLNLLRAMNEAFGQEGMDKLLAIRMREQIAHYQAHINPQYALPQKLETLAQLRTHEGYMAAVLCDTPDEWLLVENHCPICDAARTCVSLCGRELETFRRILGEGVTIERTEHILGGARRCAYRVVESKKDE
ncbi:MAG: metalloregulator ArsR/SmtB family transcription factor [Caldilineaceae bacterium]